MKGWRGAWCVKCAGFRVANKRGRCIQCGEKLAKPEGSGGFNATPTVGAYSGKSRDSKQEAQREPVLQALANAGRITGLELKPGSYELEVYSTPDVTRLIGRLEEALAIQGGSDVGLDARWLRRALDDLLRSRQKIGSYTPDFQYRDASGALVVEDVKGWKISRDFPLRKKLMVACHNVEVQVIKEQRGVQQYARGAGIKGRGTGSRLMGGR